MSGDLFTAIEPDPPAAARDGATTGRSPTGCGRARWRSWSGRSQLLRPEAPLARMLERGRLASLVLWGPPGCGKTTLARLLATAVGEPLMALSAVMAGVADLRKSVRGGAQAARARAAADPVHRRDPPLQPHPAGRPPARGRGRDGDADRGHHREPVLRADRGPGLALPRAGAGAAVRGGPADAARSAPRRRSATPCRSTPPRGRGWRSSPTATGATCSTWSRPWPTCRPSPSSIAAALAELAAAPAAGLRQGPGGALQPDQRAAQVGARLRPRRRALLADAGCCRAARTRATSRGGWCAWRSRISASPTRRRCRLTRAAAETYEQLGSPEGELALVQATLYLALAPKSNAGLPGLRRRPARRPGSTARCRRRCTSGTRRPG